jgi:hypothetical protein
MPCGESICSADKVFALLIKYLERFLLHCSAAKVFGMILIALL